MDSADLRPNSSNTKYLLSLAVLVGGMLIGVSIFTVRHFKVNSVPTQVKASTPFLTVSALGYLEPFGEIVQVAASAGTTGARLEKLLVTTGDLVKAKQVLAILDLQVQYQAALEQAQSRVSVNEAQLAKVKEGAKQGEIQAQISQVERLRIERDNQVTAQLSKIARFRAELQGEKTAQLAMIKRLAAEYQNAKTDKDRFELLYHSGGISESEYESVKLKAEAAKQQWNEAEAVMYRIQTSRQAEIAEAEAILKQIQSGQSKQIRSAEANLNRIVEVRPIDIKIAQAELIEAKANLRQARAMLETAYIRAPQTGKVLKIHTREGETIRSTGDNLGILDLGYTQQMVVVAEVYDSDVVKIKVGQPVTVKAISVRETLRGEVMEIGRIVQRRNVINTDPTANIDARIVEIRAQLDQKSSQKVANLTNLQVDVSIQIGQGEAK